MKHGAFTTAMKHFLTIKIETNVITSCVIYM